jgi:hypothetical protein
VGPHGDEDRCWSVVVERRHGLVLDSPPMTMIEVSTSVTVNNLNGHPPDSGVRLTVTRLGADAKTRTVIG